MKSKNDNKKKFIDILLGDIFNIRESIYNKKIDPARFLVDVGRTKYNDNHLVEVEHELKTNVKNFPIKIFIDHKKNIKEYAEIDKVCFDDLFLCVPIILNEFKIDLDNKSFNDWNIKKYINGINYGLITEQTYKFENLINHFKYFNVEESNRVISKIICLQLCMILLYFKKKFKKNISLTEIEYRFNIDYECYEYDFFGIFIKFDSYFTVVVKKFDTEKNKYSLSSALYNLKNIFKNNYFDKFLEEEYFQDFNLIKLITTFKPYIMGVFNENDKIINNTGYNNIYNVNYYLQKFKMNDANTNTEKELIVDDKVLEKIKDENKDIIQKKILNFLMK